MMVPCVGDTSAVGSYPTGASPYGAMDMAGNVWEWVNDWYNSGYYSVSPGSNPPGPATGDYRVLRGGSWNFNGNNVRSALRDDDSPDDGYGDLGFRCVRYDPVYFPGDDLLLLNHTEHFPKSERFRLAKRIEDAAFRFYDLLMQAARVRNKTALLSEADLELDRLRLYIRLSHNRRLTKPDQYQFAAERLTEVGRLLGGWIKSLQPR